MFSFLDPWTEITPDWSLNKIWKFVAQDLKEFLEPFIETMPSSEEYRMDIVKNIEDAELYDLLSCFVKTSNLSLKAIANRASNVTSTYKLLGPLDEVVKIDGPVATNMKKLAKMYDQSYSEENPIVEGLKWNKTWNNSSETICDKLRCGKPKTSKSINIKMSNASVFKVDMSTDFPLYFENSKVSQDKIYLIDHVVCVESIGVHVNIGVDEWTLQTNKKTPIMFGYTKFQLDKVLGKAEKTKHNVVKNKFLKVNDAKKGKMEGLKGWDTIHVKHDD